MAEILAMTDILFKASPNSITIETAINQLKVAISKADEAFFSFGQQKRKKNQFCT